MAPAKDKLWLASTRRSTFSNRRKGKNEPLNWPHPITLRAAETSTIHPDHLAHAGFYSTPHADDPTVTTCFSCGVLVGQWEEGESPLERHLAAAAETTDDAHDPIECPWANIVRASWHTSGGLSAKARAEWDLAWGPNAELHPRGPIMERARRGTFELGWPHHGKKGFPTAEQIAAAGFYFCPQPDPEASDQCDCPYCGRSAENWEKGDDPVKIHNRKDGEHCPFFLAPLPGTSEALEPKAKVKRGKASSASTAKAKKDAGGKKAKKIVERVVDEGEGEPDSVQNEDEEETDVEPQPITRATRSGSVSTVAPAPVPPRQTRRAKATPAPSEDETETAVVGGALTKSTRSRTTTASSAVPKSTRARKGDTDTNDNLQTGVVAPNPSTTTSAKAKLSKTTISSALTSSASSKRPPSKQAVDATSLVDDVEQEEVAVRRPASSGKESGFDKPVRAAPPSLPADESITDLAMIANAAYELQPSSAEDVQVSKPTKKSAKSKSKGIKSSVASTASSKSNGKDSIEVESEVGEQGIEERIKEKAVPPPEQIPSPPILEPALSLSTSTSSTGRHIRSLPTKVNPSKSPSSTSLSSKAGAPLSPPVSVPPVPTVSLASPSVPAPPRNPSTAPHLFVPWSPSNLNDQVNAFSPERISRVLPEPTPEELATLTVGEWYALNAERIRRALEAEHAKRHGELTERLGDASRRLDAMCLEAKARQEVEDRAAAVEAEEKRRKKKQLQASARKQQQGSARKTVRG